MVLECALALAHTRTAATAAPPAPRSSPAVDITYSLLPGHPTPLPAWPMRVACGSGAPGRSLNDDLGITVTGSVRDVNYTVTMGAIEASVDWGDARGNGATLTSAVARLMRDGSMSA